MTSISDNNKRIAKNTILLYIRMGISMLVSLYTSRVILNTLGVEDFGVYNVVGGIVGMLGFLNSAMSGATSRFLIFGLGRKNLNRLKQIFNSALLIHIGIAVIVFIIAETVGLWFLYEKLVIPGERMNAAVIVFQISILTAMMEITQIPYSASIISHERFGIYAYIEILNVCLKLIIVYLLVIGNWDKLILYSILVFVSSFVVMMISRLYCRWNFQECHFQWEWKREILIPMISFSGWDLYGNMSVTVRQQGMVMLINIFWGTVVNAAVGIASVVQTTISNMVINILSAFKPQIIKQYATGNLIYMEQLMSYCCKFMSILFILLSVPLIFEMNFVLTIWLGVVPEYTVSFARIVLISNWVGLMNNVFMIPIQATGQIKEVSFMTGSLYLLTLPSIYGVLYFFDTRVSVFICMLLSNSLILLVNLYIFKSKFKKFSFWKFFQTSLYSVILVLLFSIPFFMVLHYWLQEGWLRLVFSILLSLFLILGGSYLFVLDAKQQTMITDFIKKRVCLWH